MKDIIDEILGAEKRVDERLQKAREEADKYRVNAEKKASEKLEDARARAKTIIQTAVEEARKEADIVRNEMIRKAEDESKKTVQKNRERLDKLVDAVVKIAIKTEFE
jgi:F-type H+-transporting ATPase subunit b